MQKNIGVKDKNLRLGAGAILLILSLILKSWLFAIIGIILLVTAFTGYCPAYQALNADTLDNTFKKRS